MGNREELDKELDTLCQTIKAMIPSKEVKDDSTDQFKTFLKTLEEKKIDPREIECIQRSYNYFNHILGVLNVARPTRTVSRKESTKNENDPTKDPIKIPTKNPTLDKPTPEKPTPEKPTLETVGSESDKKKIKMLIELFQKEKPGPMSDLDKVKMLMKLFQKEQQTKALKDMHLLSQKVLSEIPKLDLTWSSAKPYNLKPDTLQNRLNYQIELAGLLEKILPNNISSNISISFEAAGVKAKEDFVSNKLLQEVVKQTKSEELNATEFTKEQGRLEQTRIANLKILLNRIQPNQIKVTEAVEKAAKLLQIDLKV
jgi:hypothetical protein